MSYWLSAELIKMTACVRNVTLNYSQYDMDLCPFHTLLIVDDSEELTMENVSVIQRVLSSLNSRMDICRHISIIAVKSY